MATNIPKVAIVTGSAGGIGQAIAIGLAGSGATILLADILPSDETAAAISAAGGRAVEVKCDITSADDVAALVGRAEQECGGLDILVNNAGIFPIAPLADTSIEQWDHVFAVNVRGQFLTCRASIAAMTRRGGGKIINVTSALFFIGAANLSAYIASKGAVVGLTRALARELGPLNIQVNALSPGLIRDTPGVANTGMSDEAIASFVQGQAIPRAQTTADMVGAALFLSSSQSDFMTGQTLSIDGGLALH